MANSLLRTGFGILGSIISLLMYGGPIVTFRRIIKKGTTEDFSAIPYAIALFNCLIYTLYGSPLVSHGWDNLVVMVVNGIGLVLECFFLAIFLTFAPSKTRMVTARMIAGVLMIFGTIAAVCFLAMHDHKHKQLLVGTSGMVATVVLYAAPLSVIKLVIQTKSVEFMPFNLSFFTFITSFLWLGYGAMSKDILIMAPNFMGLPLGSLQMVLHCYYRSKGLQAKDKKVAETDIAMPEISPIENSCDKQKSTDFPALQDVEMQLKEEKPAGDRCATMV